MPPHAVYRFASTSKVHLIPVEIYSEIFLLTVQEPNLVFTDQSSALYVQRPYSVQDRKNLILVCRRWHAIMLSTPGIPFPLGIGGSTKIEIVQAAIKRGRWLLDLIVDPNTKGTQEDHFDADEFHTSLTTVIEAASRWRSIEFRSFPLLGEYKGLHVIQPLEKLESFRLSQDCDLGDFFEPLMTAVTTTTTSHLTNLDLRNFGAVHYLTQPAYLHTFCSLRNLIIWLSRRMEVTVNILPYLQGLERLTARHLHLPMYPPDTSLPLVQTLQRLRLQSVSVQWMAGRVFPALWACAIIFPHYASTLTHQPATMPSCRRLEYNSNDLGPLGSFHHSQLDRLQVLQVTCGQWNVRRGNQQLVLLWSIVANSVQHLFRLDLEVRCSENLLLYVLSLVPTLHDLVLRLASPNALSEAFFRAFIVTNAGAESPCASHAITPKLTELAMYYRRWLRGPERRALIPMFGDIVSSHLPESNFSLLMMFDELGGGEWEVERPIDSIHQHSSDGLLTVGVLGPHGIVFVCMMAYLTLNIPFKEAEYLVANDQLSITCLSSLYCLVELRVGDEKNILPTAPPHNLPLFHTLRVLEAYNIHQSFFTGQTFHQLERCKILSSQEGHSLVLGLPTEMPVCTRLDAEDLTLLATLKLPLIRELGVSFDHPEFNLIWGKHIAVNANLSGLKLLHVHHWGANIDLVQVLSFLPVLKKLIVGNGEELDVSFFRAFIPVGEIRVSGSKNPSSSGGTRPPMPCPMLKGLFIEGIDPKEQPGLLVLKEVMIQRAMGGSPLKTFTFSQFQPRHSWEFRLIKGNGSFGMETVALRPVGSKPFKLVI